MAGEYTVADAGRKPEPSKNSALDSPKESAVRSGGVEKVLKIIIILAALVLLAELVWLLLISPFRPLARIDISGFDEIGREEIISMAGISQETSFFSARPQAMEQALMRYSFLESARVYRHFPDRLEIVLEGRRAVASAFAQINGLTVPVLLDRDGVVFEIGQGLSVRAFSLPVVSGLIIEDPYLGMRLPALFAPLFSELERIEMAAPELLAAVSEIRVNRNSWEGYDLIIFPVHRRIRVRLSELNEDILRYTLLMLDVLTSEVNGFREGEINSLDFRSGIASYVPTPMSGGGSLE